MTYTGHTHPLSKDSYTGTCEDGNTHSDMGDRLHEIDGRRMTEPPAIEARQSETAFASSLTQWYFTVSPSEHNWAFTDAINVARATINAEAA